MEASMQDHRLLVSSILTSAARAHRSGVVSRRADGIVVRHTYVELERRARRLAQALIKLGVKEGDRVATLAWNGFRHVELYYAVSGIGAVIHTINPRLFPDQIRYIVNDAEDVLLFFDVGFEQLVSSLAPRLPTVRAYVYLGDAVEPPEIPVGAPLRSYEGLVGAASDSLTWPLVGEQTAAGLCYTSGTTGDPKGVLYSHRSTLLHALSAAAPWAFNISAADVVLAAVPLFHVNAWGLPYICPLTGATLVLPGPMLDGRSLYELVRSERCTIAFGVPTIWMGLLAHVEEDANLRPQNELNLQRIVIGGAAAPPSLVEALQEKLGCDVVLAWGMTELSPVGTVGRVPRRGEGLDDEDRRRRLAKQGRAIYGVEMKIIDHSGRVAANDGRTSGRLLVRGPWVIRNYFRRNEPLLDEEGFFDTGDVATIDAQGFLEITDRTKDVIKSGGEWISSIELENLASGHPAVAEAAVIAVKHPRWQERPLLIVRLKPSMSATADDLLAHLAPRVAKWWLPDAVVFVDEIPHTATGKILKTALRARYGDHLVDQAAH